MAVKIVKEVFDPDPDTDLALKIADLYDDGNEENVRIIEDFFTEHFGDDNNEMFPDVLEELRALNDEDLAELYGMLFTTYNVSKVKDLIIHELEQNISPEVIRDMSRGNDKEDFFIIQTGDGKKFSVQIKDYRY